MKKKILQLIYDSIDVISKDKESTLGEQIEKVETTVLFGASSKLDSLGLINLIVTVEQKIEDEFDIIMTIADERAMSQEHSPFKTIESLSTFLQMRLEEELND